MAVQQSSNDYRVAPGHTEKPDCFPFPCGLHRTDGLPLGSEPMHIGGIIQ